MEPVFRILEIAADVAVRVNGTKPSSLSALADRQEEIDEG